MKKLLVTGSIVLTLLLGGCASVATGGNGKLLGFEVKHPDPFTEMAKSD